MKEGISLGSRAPQAFLHTLTAYWWLREWKF